MAEKILYYLGAGASAKALPISKRIESENIYPNAGPTNLIDELTNLDFNTLSSKAKDTELATLILSLKDDFETLARRANEFGNIDTYAKYLNLLNPGGSEINKLKQSLSQFFVIKQVLSSARDPRYLPWLVSIMDTKIFPENVKILSWNYDFQMQLAASEIGPSEDVNHEDSSFIHSPGMITYYPNIDPTFSDNHRLSLIHLNGIAGIAALSFPKTASVFQKKFNSDIDTFFNFILNQDLSSTLHFAWEKSDYHSKLMTDVGTMIWGTTILVVIGYSFPFFNREVDKKIMDTFKTSSFKKIYYQDPQLTGEQLRTQFDLPQHFKIEHIKATDNFHIPFEY